MASTPVSVTTDILSGLAVIAAVVFLFLLLIVRITEPISREEFGESFAHPETLPRFRFYEGFYGRNAEVDLQLPSTQPFRKLIRVNMKSLDVSIPIGELRIWNIYDGDNTASSESDFYNTYTEPEFARRANPGHYQLILRIGPGRYRGNVAFPIKRILVEYEPN